MQAHFLISSELEASKNRTKGLFFILFSLLDALTRLSRFCLFGLNYYLLLFLLLIP